MANQISPAAMLRALESLPVTEVLILVGEVLRRKRADPEQVAAVLRDALVSAEEIDRLVAPLRSPELGAEQSLKDSAIRESARQKVLAVKMFELSDVRRVLDATGGELKALSDYQQDDRLIALLDSGRRAYVFPAFQFDQTGQEVRPTVAAINVALGAANDSWGVASWWVSPHSRLSGAAPMDMLGTETEGALLPLAGLHPTGPDAEDGSSSV